MAGKPKKRAAEAAAKRAEIEESQRQWRIEHGVPLESDFRGTSGSFKKGDPRTTELAQKAVEARERKKTEVDADVQTTPADRKLALQVLRKNAKSKDEKIAHAAATKLLEYELGRPQPKQDTPERVVFESAYVNPELATAEPEA